jgi:ATP-dependent Clp protease ATP-binding subunit ClpA
MYRDFTGRNCWGKVAAHMFERFTDQARRAVVLAQEESRLLGHDYVGCEHLLLGLIQEDTGAAATVLKASGVTYAAALRQVEETVGRGQGQPSGRIPFTPQSKKALQLSLREAIKLGDNYIDTEHLLLGLLHQGEGPAIGVLMRLGADPAQVGRQLTRTVYARGRGTDDSRPARSAVKGGAKRKLLAEILAHVESIESRLTAVEQRIGAGPDVRDLDRQLMELGRDKESAIAAQDFEQAAGLRDREKDLLAERAARQREWASAHEDVPSLTEQVERLRAVLRQHGIEPHGGAA